MSPAQADPRALDTPDAKTQPCLTLNLSSESKCHFRCVIFVLCSWGSLCTRQGGPGSVRLRFGDGTVRAVPVFASGGSSLQGGPGSVRFGYGLGMERFERFRFSVLAVPLRRGFLCVSVLVPVSVPGKRFQRFRFGSWATLIKEKEAGAFQGLFRKMTLVFPYFVVYATYEQVSFSCGRRGRLPGNSRCS